MNNLYLKEEEREREREDNSTNTAKQISDIEIKKFKESIEELKRLKKEIEEKTKD